MTVTQVSEEKIVPLKLTRPERDETLPVEKPVGKTKDEAREERDAAILAGASAMLTVLARIVSVRLVLLLAAGGAFALSVGALIHPGWQSLTAMGGFDVLVFVPVIVLESGVLNRLRQ